MPISIFPQLSFPGTSGISGGARGVHDGITTALQLEQLTALKRKNQKDSLKDQAATAARTIPNATQETESGMTTNLGTTLNDKIDPEAYAQDLEKIDPEAGLLYKQALLEHKGKKQTLEKEGLQLEQDKKAQALKLSLIEHDAMSRVADYIEATQGKDKPGPLALMNQYETNEKDKTVDFELQPNGTIVFHQADGDKIPLTKEGRMYLGVTQDTQLKVWADLVQSREGKGKNVKPAPKATKPQLDVATAFVSTDKRFYKMPEDEKKVLAGQLANGVNSYQQDQVNRGEIPAEFDEAVDEVLQRFSSRLIPGRDVSIEKMFSKEGDVKARFFTSKESVETAYKKKQITEEQRNKILREGFNEKTGTSQEGFSKPEEEWINAMLKHPKNKGATREQIIEFGKNHGRIKN